MVYVKVVNRAFPLTWPAAMAANFTTGKKKHFAGAFVVTLKINDNKRQSFYHFFETLTLFSRLSPGLENCFANQFSFFQNSSRLCRNPVSYYQAYLLVPHDRV